MKTHSVKNEIVKGKIQMSFVPRGRNDCESQVIHKIVTRNLYRIDLSEQMRKGLLNQILLYSKQRDPEDFFGIFVIYSRHESKTHRSRYKTSQDPGLWILDATHSPFPWR